MITSSKYNKLLSGVAISMLATAASAQDEGQADAEEDYGMVEEIVVTGTSAARSGSDTPMAISQVGEDDLSRLTSSSQADILRTVPGIKAEGGGGEVATNVFLSGFPSGGQYAFTPIQYDGLTVFSYFGLNSSAFDVYYRNDLGIERMEFVRGGASNLFGTGSVAGIINYISKTGSDEPESTLQLEWAEENRFKADFATSGRLADDLYFAVSGWYRYDEGPVKSGLNTEGAQIRANIKKEFEDGSGSLTFYGQFIDDKVQFFLPYPLDNENRSRPIGNDGEEIFTMQTVNAASLGYDTPGGLFQTPIADGVVTKGSSFGIVFDKELDNGWGINAKAKYSDYKHQFNLFLDGDGITNTPLSQEEFLGTQFVTDVGAPTLADASFTYADSGEALASGDLVFGNRLLDRSRPAKDMTLELNITKEVETGDFLHNFTVGGFMGRAEAGDENYITTYLGEFTNVGRLVNLEITNPDMSTTTISQGGLLRTNGQTANNYHEALRYAIYAADQFESDRWVFDLGFRLEKLEGDIQRGVQGDFQMSDDPSLAPFLQSVRYGTGSSTIADVDTTEWAVAAAALYRLNDNVNLYANFSRGYFFPQLRSVRLSAQGEPATYEGEIVKQYSAGVKYSTQDLRFTVSGFYNQLNNRIQSTFENDGSGGLVERSARTATEAYGMEATVNWFLTENLRFDGNVTLMDHKITDNDSDASVIGNELARQANLYFNTALVYDDGTFDAAIGQTYVGNNFGNNSNTTPLEAFSIARLDVGYKVPVGGEDHVRLGLSVFNLFDKQGITEGSPRQGNSQSGGGAFFVGRPILPRRISLRATYKF